MNKNMVKWLIFDILKNSHDELANFFAIMI